MHTMCVTVLRQGCDLLLCPVVKAASSMKSQVLLCHVHSHAYILQHLCIVNEALLSNAMVNSMKCFQVEGNVAFPFSVCLYHSLHPKLNSMYCATVGNPVNTCTPRFSSMVLPYRCSGFWPWLTVK